VLFRGGWHYQPPLEIVFQGRLWVAFLGAADSTGRPWKSYLQGWVTAPPAPENESCFQGRVVPSPAPEDAFPGAGGKLQYPAPVVGAGYICSRPWKSFL